MIALVAAGWVAGRGPLQRAARRTRGCSAPGWPQGVRQPSASALASARWRSACWPAGRRGSRCARSRRQRSAGAHGRQGLQPRRWRCTRTAQDQQPAVDRPAADPRARREHRPAPRPRARRAGRGGAAASRPTRRRGSTCRASRSSRRTTRKLALRLLGPALYLDPQSPTGAQDYLAALRLLTTQAAGEGGSSQGQGEGQAPRPRRTSARRADRPADAAARRLPGRPARRSRRSGCCGCCAGWGPAGGRSR